MRDTHDRPAAPNLTQACIVMFGVNVAWVFMVIWAVWGLLAVAVTGWVLTQIINRIDAARS